MQNINKDLIEKFKSNEIIIKCESENDIKEFLEIAEKNGIKLNWGALEISMLANLFKNTNYFQYCKQKKYLMAMTPEYSEKTNIPIINFKELL